MDKYDTSQLTEFPRFESETNQSGVTNFFNKIWKFPLFSPSETTENLQSKAQVEDKEHVDQRKEDKGEEEIKTETGAYAVEYEGRSLQNVLKRISSLVALGTGGGTRYADTELARYWMPDDISRECYECATRFSTLRRRHHCRVCGQIFCSRCCSQRVPGQIFGCADVLRVCKYCCNVVLSYLKENEMSGEISPDLKTLQENLQVKFPENKSQQSNQGWDNFMFAREHEDRSEMRTSPKEDLQDVFRQLSFSLPTQQHRYRLVRYNGVWRGCDILQWIMENTSNKTRAQAGAVCAALLGAGYMQCIAELPNFADYALYQPAQPPPPPVACDDRSAEQPNRMVSSVSSYCLDLNVDDKSARLTRAPKTERKSSSSEDESPVIEPTEVSEPGSPSRLCAGLARRGEEHLRHLLRQCLARQALQAAWLPVLYPLCRQAAERVVTAPGGDMDVRSYVQVKKLPGGAPADCALLDAVVLTKNVAHRGMPQQISKPTVLLLDCSIAYQRVEGKHTSLEPVLMQEQEYLSRCAARITSLRPSVVLCGGRCARGVQDALRAAGVALATHVRAPALRRAARCTRADIVASVDARIVTPRLGVCEQFYVRNYSGKTLMVLEGCAEPNLGCCILLRGATLPELVRVKRVVRFMLLACYNWKLEGAFLADIEAVLPEPGAVFDDDEMTEGNDANDIKDNTEVLNILVEKSKEQRDVETKRNETIESSVTDDEKLKVSDVIKQSSNKIQMGEIDDPLLRTKSYTRKTDSDKNPSCGVPIKDFSDPLHSTLSMEDDVFQTEGEGALKADAQSDRWCADDVLLSMSPSVCVAAPYLETEAGRRCRLRRLFPRPLLPPPGPCAPRPRARPRPRPPRPRARTPARDKAQHPFVRVPLQCGAEAAGPRAALAHYRATGGLLRDGEHRPGCALYEPRVFRAPPPPAPAPPKDGGGPGATGAQGAAPDPYAPESHQQLSALLYSYSSKSPNAPDFCVNPWVVTMEMYGRHDIALGAFLDKFCFDPRLPCSSDHCNVPVNQHVRKFVHGDACITVTCNTVGRSGVDKAKEDHTKQVMFWSRCERCGCIGRARRLSRGALALSLALYLRARLGGGCGGGGAGGSGAGGGAGGVTLRGGCAHPLPAHAHAFVCNNTTAYFRHSAISPYSIQLPPDVIATRYDVRRMRDALIASLNELMHRGHETLSNVPEGEAEKEYQGFKAHTEQIHLALTATSQPEHSSVAVAVRSLWDVSDRIIFGEKMLREAQERWASPAPAPAPPAPPATKPPRPQPDNTASEEKSDLEDSTGDANSDSTGTTYVFATDTPKEVEVKEHANVCNLHKSGGRSVQVSVHALQRGTIEPAPGSRIPGTAPWSLWISGTEEDEEKGDKKTVRQILSQLLSNNRPSNENGMIISSGLVPVVVLAGEIGSVIAATLASVTYQRTLRAQLLSSQSEQDEAEAPGAAAKDKVDGDKSKAKSNDHIEVLLKDGLACRVYYAQQFHRLRHMLLAAAGADAEAGAGAGSARCGCDDTRDKSDLSSPGKCLCDVEEGFLRSLAHCVPWAARGGKSGSTFCKTKDDRYVLKEMTKPEWQQFLEFAPHYFSYVTGCRQRGQPSLLARILGVYSVGGAGVGVLVVENVWYECGAAPRYDLKGTARSRALPPHATHAPHAHPPHATHAPPADQDVLLDDNLLALRWERPLWVRGYTARVLWAALARDTRFLADSCVMDYSLLLGLRPDTLVLGVIDYIRTFTWDKKLEHLVKKNLGSGQPTVVSPEEYRRRFRLACRKYFLQCPGPWDHLYDTTHP